MKKKIIESYILGLLTIFSLVVFLLLLIIKFTISNKHYIYHIVKENKYYDSIVDEINDEMQSYIMSTGFNKDILNNLFTREDVIEDINMFIDNSFKGKTFDLKKQSIKEKLIVNIDDFIKKSQLKVLDKSDLLLFEDEIKEIYENEITLYKMTNKVVSKYPKINRIVNILLIVFGILVFTLLTFLRKINAFSLGVITFGSGIIILFIKMVVYERIDMDNILIITEKFSQLIRIVLNDINNFMLFIGLIMSLLGMGQIFTFSLQKKKKNY